MNYDEILTFIVVYNCGNIAKAAQELFIEQGTASKRVNQLEEKLGVPLFFRKKGVRKTVLTPEGEAFLPIAQQILALFNDAINLKNIKFYKELKIASTHSINFLFLLDFYKKFMRQYPEIELTSQTEHSYEIHQLIESQLMDIGFVNSLHNNPNIIAKPLFKENFVFLYHKNSRFFKTHDINHLIDSQEVLQTWSSEFLIWHKNYFPYFQRSKITLGNLSSTFEFLNDSQTWCIVSEKIASIWIKEHPDWTSSCIENPPPSRTTYLLYHKYPKPGIKKLIQLFIIKLRDELINDSSIEFIENTID